MISLKGSLFKYCLCLLIFIFTSKSTFAQIRNKLDVVAGAGMPEQFHAGLKYQLAEKSQIGAFIGSNFIEIKGEKVVSWGVDHEFHFGLIPENTTRPVWYLRQSLIFVKNEYEEYIYKYRHLGFTFGRDFIISKKIGINADLGFYIQLQEKKEYKNPDYDPWYHIGLPVIPAFRIQAFYSL